MAELFNGITELSHQECIDLLKKIARRAKREEKQTEFTGTKSNSFCGKGLSPPGKYKGNGTECIRKGFGVGNSQGEIKGINKERGFIYNLIKKNTG